MEKAPSKPPKLVFRLCGLPNAVQTAEDVKRLVNERLDDVPAHSIHVYSLATSLYLWENPPSRVATIMFDKLPSFILDNPDNDEWAIPSKGVHANNYSLILDTNFLGMTPLNDIQPPSCHLYDCIAISGLASHPFGSWQPKGGDKSFMWIRDSLPNDLAGTRAILYGYDTKLPDSNSFKRILDLASALVNHLRACGWDEGHIKPVAFLAHSLGGLILKQALVQFGMENREEYNRLSNRLRGVVFFGVPNLGMEQEHFRAIVQNKANEGLVDEISPDSNSLLKLEKEFSKSPLRKHLRCFWAYETSKSPTITMTADGNLRRDGPSAILVDRESATCRFIRTDRAATFPINETHSDMVKFRQGSHDYNIVVSKLWTILCLNRQSENGKDMFFQSNDQRLTPDESNQRTASQNSQGMSPSRVQQRIPKTLSAAYFEAFRRESTLTTTEEEALKSTTDDDVLQVIRSLQNAQEESGNLMYMGRLEPILLSMQQFGGVAGSLGWLNHNSHAMAYVWGSVKYVLQMVSDFPEALNCVLDAYQGVGEQIPRLQGLEGHFASSSLYPDILILIYKDILTFHGELIRLLKQRQLKRLFKALWRDFTAKVEHIQKSIARKTRSLENRVSITEFEEIQKLQSTEDLAFNELKDKRESKRRAMVQQWLSPFDCQSEQVRFGKERSICKDPGRWLLNDIRFQKWLNPEHCDKPAIWLSGIPGAGKTILASIVVDEIENALGATVAFFYCKHGEKNRNTFLSVAKSILAQLLTRHPHLLPFFHERASMSNETTLESEIVAKEMIEIALKSCEKTYLVIDGVDECRRDDRQIIASFFREIIENLPITERVSIRCLFVSQDDGAFQKYFRDLPTIKIVDENREDLKSFALFWHQRIEEKFGDLKSKNYNISNIISARAQGMFIFAELFAKYLEDQISRAALIEELKPEKLPVNLDHVYGRILDRILESRGQHTVKHLRHILGWIVCARRPLKWREIQGAISLNLKSKRVDYDKEIAESPKGLFASIVKLQEDGTVELVHSTARDYLSRHFVDIQEADYSMTTLSLGYLTLPQVDRERNESDIKSDLLSGIYSFYDYASACWGMHLQDCFSNLKEGDDLAKLQKIVEKFVECHWSTDHKPLPDTKRIQDIMAPIQESDYYGKIIQALAWAKKQSGRKGSGPKKEEAIDLWRVTEKVRSTLENMKTHSTSESDITKLERFYGKDWFKCPRINCYHYHQGFKTVKKRNRHVDRHERPFLCMVSGCPHEIFGYATQRDLKKHILERHGIDELDDVDDTEFPGPPKENASRAGANSGQHQCHICSKTFTRKSSLKNHLLTHEKSKPFKCKDCNERFTRKDLCKRHEISVHCEKTFVCTGELKDGTKWGCNASFGRADSLANHFRSRKGQACLRPLAMEKSREGIGSEAIIANVFAGQVNKNSLMAAYKTLPSFGEFLKLCELDIPAEDARSK